MAWDNGHTLSRVYSFTVPTLMTVEEVLETVEQAVAPKQLNKIQRLVLHLSQDWGEAVDTLIFSRQSPLKP